MKDLEFVAANKAGYAWAGGLNNDRIVRVNVDNSTSTPTFWIGNNLGATLIKVEPVE